MTTIFFHENMSGFERNKTNQDRAERKKYCKRL